VAVSSLSLIGLVAIVAYVLLLIDDSHIGLLVFLPVLGLVTLILALILVSLVVTRLFVLFLPPGMRKVYRSTGGRLATTVFVCLVCLLPAALLTNLRWLPGVLHPLSLAVDTALVVVVALLGSTLMRPTRKKLLVFSTSALGFILIVFFVGSIRLGSSERETTSVGDMTALAYLTWRPVANTERIGVTRYYPDRSFPGLNLYASVSTAYLMDMQGVVLHQWTSALGKIDHVALCDNGDLLLLVGKELLVLLDWDSKVKWARRGTFHHDVIITDNDDIYTLTRKQEFLPIHGLPLPTSNEFVALLTPSGRITKEVSLFALLRGVIPDEKYKEVYSPFFALRNLGGNLRLLLRSKGPRGYHFGDMTGIDLIHVNTVESIDEDIEGLFGTGNLLICCRSLDLVAVIDPEMETLVWSWGIGILDKPHDPTLLDNGDILVFDNGPARGYSRVVEYDPAQQEIVWQYVSDPPEDFFSSMGGGCQRLPNGNTLITASTAGRVFEVSRTGEVVWEFYNPEVNQEKSTRAVIYRMYRITDPEGYSCLEGLFPPPASPAP